MAALSVATGLASATEIMASPQDYPFPFRQKYLDHLVLVRCHASFAITALLVGGLQFFGSRKGKWHRLLGTVYLCGVLGGGLTGVGMAYFAFGGIISRSGYFLVAILWLGTGVQAYLSVLRKDFAQHKVWMVRNFALTFGAVVLRLYLYLAQELGGCSFDQVYPSAVWVSWSFCMLVGEWTVSKGIDLKRT